MGETATEKGEREKKKEEREKEKFEWREGKKKGGFLAVTVGGERMSARMRETG